MKVMMKYFMMMMINHVNDDDIDVCQDADVHNLNVITTFWSST